VAGISPKGKEYLSTPNKRVNILSGSVSSGKSYLTALRFIKELLLLEGSYTHIIAGYTVSTAMDNVVNPIIYPILDELSRTGVIDFKTKGFSFKINKQRVIIVGMNNSLASNRIRGVSLNSALCDEINLFDKDGFMMLLSRMRDGPNPHIIATMNPGSPYNFIEKFKRDVDPKLCNSFHFVLDDNINLEPEYIKYIKSMYVPGSLEYKRFILGLPTMAEGLIYSGFNDDNIIDYEFKFVSNPMIEWDGFAVGIDYGASNYHAATFFGFKNDCFYILDDYITPKDVLLTDEQLIMEIVSKFKLDVFKKNKQNHFLQFYTPHDATSLRTSLSNAGWNVTTHKPDTLKEIAIINGLFYDNKILIAKQCEVLLEEIAGYVWDIKASERGVDAPEKKADHLCISGDMSITICLNNVYRDIKFRKLAEINLKDNIVTTPSINLGNFKVEWKRITNIQYMGYKDIVNYGGVECTPDHEFFYLGDKRCGNYVQKLPVYSVKPINRRNMVSYSKEIDFNIKINPFYTLWGFYLGDGTKTKVRYNNRANIRVNKKSKIDYLKRLFKESKLDYKITIQHYNNIDYHNFIFKDFKVKDFDLKNIKITKDNVSSVLSGLTASDGYLRVVKFNNRFNIQLRFSNKDVELINLFKLCVELIGGKVSVKYNKESKTHINGRMVKSDKIISSTAIISNSKIILLD
jgi:PBSX family phage terminase large subunit